MTLFVSVCRAVLVNNHKNKTNNPPYEVRTDKDDKNPRRVHSAEFSGKVKLMYDPANPLICGAVAWLEIEEEQK